MEVGDPVAEPGAEVQKGRGRLSRHAAVAVGGSGRDTLEEAKHRAHALDLVEGRDEMHFRGAGIGEGDIDAAGQERAHQAFGTVHPLFHDIHASKEDRL